MKRIYKYAKGYYKYVFLSPLFVIMEAVLEVLIPLVNKNLIDVGIKNQDLKYIFGFLYFNVNFLFTKTIFVFLLYQFNYPCSNSFIKRI